MGLGLILYLLHTSILQPTYLTGTGKNLRQRRSTGHSRIGLHSAYRASDKTACLAELKHKNLKCEFVKFRGQTDRQIDN